MTNNLIFQLKIPLYLGLLLAGVEPCAPVYDYKLLFVDSFGKCPEPFPNVVTNFDKDQYLGRWYEVQRFTNFFQAGDCGTADYSLNPDGSVRVINAYQKYDKLGFVEGTLTDGPDTTLGALIVNFPQSPTTATTPNYNILETDYTNYAVVYSCSSRLPGFKIETSWIISRTETLDQAFLDALKIRLSAVGVPIHRYNPINQVDCPRIQPSGRYLTLHL